MRHFDGVGLYLIVNGRHVGALGEALRAWRPIALDGLRPGQGMLGLAEARERNRRVSQQLADGVNPLWRRGRPRRRKRPRRLPG